MTSIGGLADRQDSEAGLRLLKAIAVAHLHNQRAQALSLGLSAVLAVAGLVVGPTSRYGTAVAVGGALWAIVYKGLLTPWAERSLRLAATLQEMFDTDMFDLPWNRVTVGDRIDDDEVSRLSRRFRGDVDRLRGYYLVARTAAPYGVLFCLKQNLAWGSRIRLRFAQMMLGLLMFWTAFGLLVTLIEGSTVAELIRGWFVPSLGLLLVCLELYRTQMASIRERLRVLGLVRAAMEDPSSTLITNPTEFRLFARQVQDTLYHLRRLQSRLPAWFFRRYHDQDKLDFEIEMQKVEERFPAP